MNIRTIVIGLILILILGVGGYFVWNMFAGGEVEAPVVETPVPQPPADSTFASSTLGLSVKYPPQYILNSSYTNDAFGAQKLIHGVQFLVPAASATGTNLVAADTGVSIEWLPNARNCTGDIYLKANVKPTAITDGAVQYSVATSTTAVAGGSKEEMVYALVGSKPCTAVRYSIHTATAASSSAPVQSYNRSALLAQFDKIRQSLVVSR